MLDAVTVLSIPSPSQGVWHLGPLPIRGYALAIILGIVAAIWIGERRWAARGGRRGDVQDIAVWAVPFGLVGVRFDLDVGADRIGVILEVCGILHQVLLAFLLDAFDLDVSLLHAGSGHRLLGTPFLRHVSAGAARTQAPARIPPYAACGSPASMQLSNRLTSDMKTVYSQRPSTPSLRSDRRASGAVTQERRE